MRQQKLHLVSQDFASLEVNVLGVCRGEGNREQLHTRLLRCLTRLVVIAAFAGGDHVGPDIQPTLADRFYMVARQQEVGKAIAAIKAQVLVPPEQGLVAEGWYVAPGE